MNPTILPDGYFEIKKIDFQKDKKFAVAINIAGLVIAIIMLVAAALIWGLEISLSIDFSSAGKSVLYLLSFVLALLAYMVLHEAIHGIFMKKFSGCKPSYGFTGMYAYAGSDAYFNKNAYRIISLAPVVILGAVLLFLNFALPANWFWFIYIIQTVNLSGAVGDFYMTSLMRKLPPDVLVLDTGVSMTIYSAAK